jgi:hypothetical protein
VTICADTGNGGTITASAPVLADGVTSATAVAAFFTGLAVKRIEFPEESLERIECSHLGTTIHRSYIASDLTDPPQVNLTANFETTHTVPFVGQVLGTFTVTFPTRPGETAPATYAGTAYVGAVTRPSLANGELQEIQLRIDFDGVTGPAFTPATTV